ncbi:hypothetical protein [Goodfellowiella coeruleoviolacea]|uniref:Uncharacterized protein n=1 Tax=Goodfellowiella coeruleoviolacea TaxID=334858 RepID=A0AAE3GHD3_9PSEU|nr:hypothetical protein [Goodfellowiella coeruleoviolacea]MCP2167309.1 hypothetical protein [Goodfellowiella coeruleoviolacea]
MTTAAAYGWRVWDEDQRPHAVLTSEIDGDTEGLIDAACGKVLTAANSTRIDKPTGMVCLSCVTAMGQGMGDNQWRC